MSERAEGATHASGAGHGAELTASEQDGGDEGTRTPDPRDANAVLFQLSYIPTGSTVARGRRTGRRIAWVGSDTSSLGARAVRRATGLGSPRDYPSRMPFGLLTGLTAAVCWGTLDVITALGSRVVGSLRVTAGMQLVTAVIFGVLVVVTGTVLPGDPSSIALAVLLGLIGAGAYLSYFTGLLGGTQTGVQHAQKRVVMLAEQTLDTLASGCLLGRGLRR